MTKSQTDLVIAHLLSGKTLTHLEAESLGMGTRVAARVQELRKAGNLIDTEMVRTPGGAHVARYRLAKETVPVRPTWTQGWTCLRCNGAPASQPEVRLGSLGYAPCDRCRSRQLFKEVRVAA